MREEAVDFTSRFYEDIYSIFIKPVTYPHYYFIYPMSNNYWIALFAVLVATWIVLIIFGVVSKHTNPDMISTSDNVIPGAATLAMIVLRISLSQSKYTRFKNIF